MDIVIAGGHGKVARHLTTLLAARGDRVRGLIRNPDHAADLRADGSEPVVLDLEQASVEEVAARDRGRGRRRLRRRGRPRQRRASAS